MIEENSDFDLSRAPFYDFLSQKVNEKVRFTLNRAPF